MAMGPQNAGPSFGAKAMLHYQPRQGKAPRAKPRQTPQKFMECVSCDVWAHCMEKAGRMLCYVCRAKTEE